MFYYSHIFKQYTIESAGIINFLPQTWVLPMYNAISMCMVATYNSVLFTTTGWTRLFVYSTEIRCHSPETQERVLQVCQRVRPCYMFTKTLIWINPTMRLCINKSYVMGTCLYLFVQTSSYQYWFKYEI